MKVAREVDLRVLLEAASGVALAMALLMPFFTVSSKSYLPVSAVTSIVDSIPREPIADLFAAVAGLSLILSAWRILRPPSGLVVILASLTTFVAAGVLVAILQAQWNDATSGWQMDAARMLGAEFSQSFGFWVYFAAAALGGGLVLTELISRLIRRAHSVDRFAGTTHTATKPDRPAVPALVGQPTHNVESGRVAVLDSGRSTSITIELGQTIIVGRDPDCGIRLADPKVSRRHASIERVAGGWAVSDLGTTNPTRLIRSGGATVQLGPGARVASGQLLIGDALVSLYP
jgi:hypothetical protein